MFGGKTLFKAAAAVTALSMLTASFAGCEKAKKTGKEENGKVSISICAWPNKDASPEKYARREEQKERFNKLYPDIEIVPDEWVFDVKTFLPKAEGGTLPTLYPTYFTEGKKIMDLGYAADITKEFKIIGFYDTKNEIRFNNDCYISKDDIKEISDFVNPLEKDTLYATSIVVDDTKNIEFVKNEIKKLGIVSDAYTIETVAGFDTGLISLIRVSCLLLLNVILVVTFFLAISYMKKRIIDENKNINVMKFMGFTKKNLNNLFLIQNIIMNLIAYIIGFVAFLIIYIIIKNTLLYAINYSIINISINLFPILLSFVVIMSSSIIVILYIKELFSRNNYAQL